VLILNGKCRILRSNVLNIVVSKVRWSTVSNLHRRTGFFGWDHVECEANLWHWDRFYCEFFGFPLSMTRIIPPMLYSHSSVIRIMKTVWSRGHISIKTISPPTSRIQNVAWNFKSFTKKMVALNVYLSLKVC